MAAAIEARIEGAVDGQVVGYAAGVLAMLSDKAYPPGKPLACDVRGEATMQLRGRAIGSKLQEDGRFLVRMRLTNLRKEHRQHLEQHFEAS